VSQDPSRLPFESLLQLLHEFLLVLDSDGVIQDFWRSSQAPRGDPQVSLLGRRLSDILDRRTCEQLRELSQRAVDADRSQDLEYSAELADGVHYFSVRALPVAPATGGSTALCLLARDITHRKSATEDLQKSAALLAQAEQLANLGSWEHNLDTREIVWSAQLYRVLQLDPGLTPLTEDLVWQLVHPDDREGVRRNWEEQRTQPQPYEYEGRWIRTDGRIRTLHTRGVPVIDSSGRVSRVVGMSQDITDRKEAEERLRESVALLAQAEQLANMGSGSYNLRTREMVWSAQLYRVLGLDPDGTPITAEGFYQLVHPEDRERVRQELDQLIAQPQPFEQEVRFVLPDGRIRTLHTRCMLVTDSSGCAIHIVGMSQDITDRKEAEERLQKSETLLAEAEQLANFGSWGFDFKTRKPILSKQLLQMYGMASEAEWTEEMYWERLHPKDRQQVCRIADLALAACKPYEYVSRYHAPDGHVRVHFVRGVPILGADGKPERAIGFVQDITDQARAEEDLRRLSQELIRASDEGRRHVARDLHESAGQSLAALKMTLGRLRDSLPEDSEPAQELLQSSVELAESVIREVRTLSYLMHPPLLDEAGLGSALRWYAEGFSKRSGIAVRVEVSDDFGRHSQEIETTVFRIVQESLTNVHRYSGSRTATIHLGRDERQIVVEVRDEGCGLVLSAPDLNGRVPYGVGIAGMRERVKHLDGVFKILSDPGHGTTVRAILPLSAPVIQARFGEPHGSV